MDANDHTVSHEETNAVDGLWDALRAILELPEDEFREVLKVLDASSASRSKLVESVASGAPSLDRVTIDNGLAAAIGYMGGWLGAGLAIDKVDERILKQVLRDGDPSPLRERATEFLSTPGIRMYAGELHVSQSRGHDVSTVRMSVDYSPLTSVEPIGSALLPSVRLAFDHYGAGSLENERQTAVTLDIADLRSLKKNVDRVLEEIEKTSSVFAAAGITVRGRDVGSSDDD